MDIRTPAVFLDGIIVKKPVTYQGLTLFPLCLAHSWLDKPDAAVSLSEGVRSGAVRLEETGAMESVRIRNISAGCAVALDGETLTGGAQDRMLTAPAVLSAGCAGEVPACCIEVHRWEKAKAKSTEAVAGFESGGFAYGALRRLMMENAESHFRKERKAGTDQKAVWSDIVRCFLASGASTKTLAMRELYDFWSEALVVYEQRFSLLKGQVGVAAFLGRKAWFVDVFGSYDLLAKYIRPLIRSYAFDDLMRIEAGRQMNEREHPVADAALNIIKGMKLALCHQYDIGAGGKGLFFSTKNAIGTVLHDKGRLIHLSVSSRSTRESDDREQN